MDLFQAFQQRALQAVDAAKELASTVGTDALGTAQTVAATLTTDAKDMARDAQQKVGVKSGNKATDSADAHVSEALLAHVRTLSCSSFLDSSPSAAASSEVVAKPLAAWRVEHATSMLQQSPELESLRYALVPKRLSDEQFWRRYFALVEHLLGDEEDDSVQHTPHTAPSHRSHQTSRSGTSAWEDLGQSPIPAPGSSPSLRKAQGDAELDDYMKGMLDDGDLPAAASGDEEADNLEDYLQELEAGGGSGGEGGGGEDAVGDDVSKYLEDLGLDDDHDDDGAAKSPAGGAKAG